MRSYTNKDGELIEVSKEHLNLAVRLKIELQDSVPSRKCNWNTHKRFMEEEGFYDSEKSEAYRCLVKDYQKEIGLLVSAVDYANMVSDSKIECIRREIGEIYHAKKENQVKLRELNKLKSEFSLSLSIIDEVRDAFIDSIDFNIPNYVYNPRFESSKNKMIAVLTDLHIGELINNVLGNSYNYEIAQKRMNLYANRIIYYCRMFNVTDLEVCGLGDFVEHAYMRARQGDNVEFKLAQQMVKASDLIIRFLVNLSSCVNVTYTGIAGNHDRLQGDKNISSDDDNANVVINGNIKSFIELLETKKIEFIDTDDGATEIMKDINGKMIKLVHGHYEKSNKSDSLMSHISMDSELYDCLIHGHLHHFNTRDSDSGRLVYGVGSLSGRNKYSKDVVKSGTDASQGILVVTNDGEMIPLRVGLQII